MTSTNARFLAPAALAAAFLALIVAVIASGILGGGDSDYKAAESPKNTVAAKTEKATPPKPKPAPKPAPKPVATSSVYVVKDGQDIAAVAQKSGVTVAKLIELNPDIDPVTLEPGQKLKLR